MLVYRDEVLVDESHLCREAGIENGSRLLCRINPVPNSGKRSPARTQKIAQCKALQPKDDFILSNATSEQRAGELV